MVAENDDSELLDWLEKLLLVTDTLEMLLIEDSDDVELFVADRLDRLLNDDTLDAELLVKLSDSLDRLLTEDSELLDWLEILLLVWLTLLELFVSESEDTQLLELFDPEIDELDRLDWLLYDEVLLFVSEVDDLVTDTLELDRLE